MSDFIELPDGHVMNIAGILDCAAKDGKVHIYGLNGNTIYTVTPKKDQDPKVLEKAIENRIMRASMRKYRNKP